MKLQPKGENEYTAFHHVPSIRASAETSVIMSAYQMALESVLASVTADNGTEIASESHFENFLALRKLSDQIRDDLDRGDLILDVIEARLTKVNND